MKLKFILLIISVLTYRHSVAQEGIVPDTIEKQALEELYNNTNGEFWVDQTNWMTTEPIGEWFGVTVLNGDIVKLDLSYNDLEGTIPESLYKLVTLEELWLEYNFLEGQLSAQVANLERLQSLGLRYNSLNGYMTPAIGSLQNLQFLDLYGNNFDGSLPNEFYNLSNLRELYLGFNAFSGTVSSDIMKLSSLEVFQLEDNLFEGELPASIGFCSNLTDIFIGYNLFSGSLPQTISNLTNLVYIDIVGSSFTGSLPNLNRSEGLYYVYFAETNITSLGNLHLHPYLSDIGIYVDKMKLEFGDLEPFFNADGTPRSYFIVYDSQDSINTYFTSESNTFAVEVEGTQNQYQWFKDGNPLASENDSQLALGSSFDEAATYHCEVTNTRIPDLTLYSKKKTLRAGEFYAVRDGNWNDAIWAREKDGEVSGEVPALGSKVFIIGKNVQVNTRQECGQVEVIVENQAASLTVSGADLTIYGELKLTKVTEGYEGNVKVINGGRIIPSN